MRHEKPKLRDEWNAMQQDKLTNMVVRLQLQDQLKDILVGEHRLLNDLSLTRRLTDIKKNYDEATEMYSNYNKCILQGVSEWQSCIYKGVLYVCPFSRRTNFLFSVD